MKRIPSKATLLKKRVRKIQNRAKFVGFLYLIGTIALLAITACMPILTGTCITAAGATDMPVLTFYQPILDLFAGGAEAFNSLTAAQITKLIVVVLFGAMLLTMAINVLRSIGKLGWLFKRRASYSNGFNRNMYAMDDMADRFSNSLYALVMINLFIYLFSGGLPAEGQEATVQLTTNAYIALGVGFGLHFICGLIGGTVTLFSTGDRVEEEVRENGLFVFFVRNLIQIAAVAAIGYFLLQESVLVAKIQEVLVLVIEEQKPLAEIDWMSALPAGLELLAWIFVAVLVGHAVADTEFNRDGVVGSGMRNFTIFSFLAAVALAAGIALPMLGIGVAEATTELNQNLLIAAAVALVAFLLDCIIRPRARDDMGYDDVDMDAYFQGGEQKYNNTII
ncbi:MAG: hypothetical protein J6B56_00295 [Clostridia bacterium]|nr:hypothetical protein [Clostridia bacterium]